MSVRKSGSRAVSLKLSARPEAMRRAHSWSLGWQSSTRSERVKARTCWRRTSGWKSGLDSRAIGTYDLRFTSGAPNVKRRYWENRFRHISSPDRGKFSKFFISRHEVVILEKLGGCQH